MWSRWAIEPACGIIAMYTPIHTHVYTETETEMVKKPAGMLVVFIDFEKAYDKVDQVKLWSCLQSVGVNSRFLRFLQALYEGSACRVEVNGQISEEFEVNTGLCQGCVLSPLLFSLYINSVHGETIRVCYLQMLGGF